MNDLMLRKAKQILAHAHYISHSVLARVTGPTQL